MPSQTERLSSIEAKLSLMRTVLTISLSILTPVSVAAFGWVWHLSESVTALKQNATDKGANIVSELTDPQTSPARLKAALTTIVASVQTAAASGATPDSIKVRTLAKAVAGVSSRQPQLTQVWQAAGQLISARSVSNRVATTRCSGDDHFKAILEIPGSMSVLPEYLVELHDCEMDLSRPEEFLPEDFFVKGTLGGERPIHYKFTRVKVSYSGGAILTRAVEINFIDCTFDFEINTVPPLPGQRIARELLVADQINSVDLTIA